jgi:hypothetical protein
VAAELMARTTVTVEVGWRDSDTWGTPFTLDDATKGLLDSATYVLAGHTWTDITQYVQGFTTKRGRIRELDSFRAGTATIALKNNDRRFDPLNASGPYYGGLMVRCPVRITANNAPVYYGFIEDLPMSYPTLKTSVIELVCSDALGLLATSNVRAYTPVAARSGVRMREILRRDEVTFPEEINELGSSFDFGVASLGAYPVEEGTKVLDYFAKIVEAEFGRLFCAADGPIIFQQRDTTPGDATGVIIGDSTVGIPAQEVTVEYGSEFFCNQVSVTRVGGTTQVAVNQNQKDAFWTRDLNYTDTLHIDDARALTLAQYLLNRYQNAELRIASARVNLDRLVSTDQDTLLDLEIGVNVTVQYTPPGGGSAITQTCTIVGIAHDRTPDFHNVTFDFAKAA